MIFLLNKDADNKNLIRTLKLGGVHGQIGPDFCQCWCLRGANLSFRK